MNSSTIRLKIILAMPDSLTCFAQHAIRIGLALEIKYVKACHSDA
jgi:hypothetical protein